MSFYDKMNAGEEFKASLEKIKIETLDYPLEDSGEIFFLLYKLSLKYIFVVLTNLNNYTWLPCGLKSLSL